MLERELILRELWKRMSQVDGVKYTARNPKAPPSTGDLPAIQFFELPDTVESASSRGGYPIYKRKMAIAIELIISAEHEGASSKVLGEFANEVKKKLYAGGVKLGGRNCQIQETDASRVLRPPIGDNVSMIGINLEIIYIEDTNLLFA